MEAKLIKVEDVYRLLREDNLIIGTTDYEYQKAFSDHCYKLSLKNCQAIERGYDLDELAYRFNPVQKLDNEYIRNGFKAGFQKALEILGDKKFNEEDMQRAMNWIMTQYFEFHEQPTMGRREHYIQSLQQTEWDCIVEMEDFTVVHLGGDNEIISQPKLDADGCIVLKRKQINNNLN